MNSPVTQSAFIKHVLGVTNVVLRGIQSVMNQESGISNSNGVNTAVEEIKAAERVISRIIGNDGAINKALENEAFEQAIKDIRSGRKGIPMSVVKKLTEL